jgi:hypothetical protein
MNFGIYTLCLENFLRKRFAKLELEFIKLPIFEGGWGNGYVLLPHNHPLYEKNYDDLRVYAHRGLTYSNYFSTKFLNNSESLELEIDGDVNRENCEKFNKYWMIGFDTNHLNDNLTNCTKEYVMDEVQSLLDQCLDNDIEGMKKYKNFYSRRDKLKKLNSLMP